MMGRITLVIHFIVAPVHQLLSRWVHFFLAGPPGQVERGARIATVLWLAHLTADLGYSAWLEEAWFRRLWIAGWRNGWLLLIRTCTSLIFKLLPISGTLLRLPFLIYTWQTVRVGLRLICKVVTLIISIFASICAKRLCLILRWVIKDWLVLSEATESSILMLLEGGLRLSLHGHGLSVIFLTNYQSHS